MCFWVLAIITIAASCSRGVRIVKTKLAEQLWMARLYWQFPCRLARWRRVELKLALDEIINHADDHVIILDLGPATAIWPRIESLGKSFSVVDRGPVIV
jgi:hypothetical protein